MRQLHWGKLYHKECFTKIRYPNGRIHEDEYVTYRILFRYPEIAVIQAPLYAYYVNPEGITKSAWKPNRMDIFPAFEHQIAFFKKKGMKDLMELRIRNYLWSVELQMDEVNSRSDLPRQYDRRLRRRLGSILLRWRDLYPFEQNKKRYETAFPKGMWLYWTIEGLKYKFFKKEVSCVPEISVIVPIYNTEKYLARCIDSILLQTYTDFELILVDDGSTDQSGMICEDYARKDSRVRVFHQKNQGQAAARNFALDWIDKNSSSAWISFVDSDDWIHPQMLEYLYGIACNNKTKIGICGYSQTVGDMPRIEQEQLCTRFYDVETFYCENVDVWAVVPWGKIYHKDCFKGIRYPLVRACEDEFVTYKILFQFSTLPVMEAPLYYYFMSEK